MTICLNILKTEIESLVQNSMGRYVVLSAMPYIDQGLDGIERNGDVFYTVARFPERKEWASLFNVDEKKVEGKIANIFVEKYLKSEADQLKFIEHRSPFPTYGYNDRYNENDPRIETCIRREDLWESMSAFQAPMCHDFLNMALKNYLKASDISKFGIQTIDTDKLIVLEQARKIREVLSETGRSICYVPYKDELGFGTKYRIATGMQYYNEGALRLIEENSKNNPVVIGTFIDSDFLTGSTPNFLPGFPPQELLSTKLEDFDEFLHKLKSPQITKVDFNTKGCLLETMIALQPDSVFMQTHNDIEIIAPHIGAVSRERCEGSLSFENVRMRQLSTFSYNLERLKSGLLHPSIPSLYDLNYREASKGFDKTFELWRKSLADTAAIGLLKFLPLPEEPTIFTVATNKSQSVDCALPDWVKVMAENKINDYYLAMHGLTLFPEACPVISIPTPVNEIGLDDWEHQHGQALM